jgi:hypothetical protein
VKNHYAVQTGLADRGKRHMADAYGFTEEQLFGPSAFRNAGDIRIPKNSFHEVHLRELPLQIFPSNLVKGTEDKYQIRERKCWIYTTNFLDSRRPHCINVDGSLTIFVPECDPEFWLSPRESLQIYLEKMNTLDVYTWIRKGVEDQLALVKGGVIYERMKGLVPGHKGPALRHHFTCFADFRHIPEIEYVRNFSAHNPKFMPILVRVKRPSIKKPPYNHRSETEQTKIRDAAFDVIVQNDKDLPHLYAQMDEIVLRAKAGDIPSNPWRSEYIIQDRVPAEGYAP